MGDGAGLFEVVYGMFLAWLGALLKFAPLSVGYVETSPICAEMMAVNLAFSVK